jgi:hypothetical protein
VTEPLIVPGCSNCVHLHDDLVTCDAYPGGIPLPIQMGDVPHTTPLSEDNGIQWQPKSAQAS